MTRIIGILNITPDSFSGDGMSPEQAASARLKQMIAEGAHGIDIGAESTRPGARLLSAEEEWQRLAAVMQVVPDFNGVWFSIDTRHAAVARKALQAGCLWINDVSGTLDPDMLELVAGAGATYVPMHSLGAPASLKRTLPTGSDPVQAVCEWMKRAVTAAEQRGVKRTQIVLDPGIGFGKTAAQSLALIQGAGRLKAIGLPLLIGHSRKSFLSLFTDRPAAERDSETLVISSWLAAQGVDYLRVHDVKGHSSMLRIREAL